MADVDVTQLSAYSSPTGNDILIVIKAADDSLNNTTISELLSLVSVPSAYTSNPAALGTASPGSSTAWARGDHVHAKPTYSKSDVGLGNVDNVQQYSASNPPPYPVTSVNGATGAVTVAQVFWAEYGTTTSSDIEAAYRAGKVVLLDYSGDIYTLSQIDDSTHEAFFTCVLDDTVYTISVASDYWDASSYVTIPTTAANVGAIAAPASPTSGQFLKWNGSAWIADDLPVYNGGVS